MRLGVCIPCYKNHVKYIQQCLESIEKQTRKPDVVSISFSEVTEPPVLPAFSFPIEIITTSKKQCQGKNRNLAASKIDVDILSFFDADDIMHPNRLAYIEAAFSKGLDGFLHNHKQCASSQYRISYTNILWEELTEKLYTDGFSTTKDSICGRVESIYGGSTNGHFSCKQSVWKSIQCLEGYGLGEDCEYVYQIHQAGYKLGYTPDKLSYYIRDDFPEDFNSYDKHTSIHRHPVYTNYKNTEIINVIEYLLSERSPIRTLPIFIIDQVHEFPETPTKKIIYNIEQMTRQNMLEKNLPIMKRQDIIEVWDYSISNYNILKNHNLNIFHVPFKLTLEKILNYRNLQTLDKTYDVAFSGQMGPYRQSILDQLKVKGLEVLILDGDYSLNRDVQIGRSRLLLNIHFNETYKVFETIRCEPWLSSGFPVISETSLDDDVRAINTPYTELVDKVCEVLESIRIKPQATHNLVFYCEDLEMRNPKHYHEYTVDRDVYVYNMALECKNKGYNVTVYAYTVFDNYNDILFKNPKSFNTEMPIYICILLPPFNKKLQLKNTNHTYICMDKLFNLDEFNLYKVSKIFFESKYIRNMYSYIPDNKCSVVYDCFNPIIELNERKTFKILCTQSYDEELFNLLYGFWPIIRQIVPNATFTIVSDSSIPYEHRMFLKNIIEQPGIIERGLISKDELDKEKQTSLIHINLSSKPESIESLETSIELGCLPILSNIYKHKYGIHISEPTSTQRCIEKVLKIYLSLINTETLIIDEFRSLLKLRYNTISNSLIDVIEHYLNPSSSLRSEK